jgi:hypothetical protein
MAATKRAMEVNQSDQAASNAAMQAIAMSEMEQQNNSATVGTTITTPSAVDAATNSRSTAADDTSSPKS